MARGNLQVKPERQDDAAAQTAGTLAVGGAADEVPDREKAVAQENRRISVIYIGGVGRSGSTLIERILETYSGVCSVGELGLLHLVSSFGRNLSSVTCPCGAVVAECEHWRALRHEAALTDEELAELMRLQSIVFRTRSFLLYYLPVVGSEVRRSASRLAVLTERLYRAAAKIENSDLVVDGSNYAIGALVAARMPSVHLYVLHVVRAPEAVVHSWRKPKHHPAFDTPTSGRGPLRVLIGWWLHNLMVEALRFKVPVHRLRYEEFACAPRERIAELLSEVVGKTMPPSPAFEDERTIDFDVSHAILGNPALFAAGRTKIAADERFLREQSPAVRWASVLLTLPLRWLYGYRTVPQPPAKTATKRKKP